jgi:RimJ/RimL family protein N-acetyltransferase
MISIRQLQENDWPVLKQIRLKALKSDPGVFGGEYEIESQNSDQEWRDIFKPYNAIFGIYDGETLIGTTSVGINIKDPTGKSAILWGSWLEPSYRSKGISRLMYQARIDWARSHPGCEKITVSHRASNLASGKANQKQGFVYTHTTPKTWPDGAEEDEVHYELRLR